MRQEIASEEPALALPRGSSIPGGGVQVSSHCRSDVAIESLCQQAGDDAGQGVAHAAARHARITSAYNPYCARFAAHDGSRSLENDDASIAVAQRLRRCETIRLHLCG